MKKLVLLLTTLFFLSCATHFKMVDIEKSSARGVVHRIGVLAADKNTEVRSRAVKRLSDIATPDAKPYLVTALKDRDKSISRNAAEGLLKYPPSPDINQGVINALEDGSGDEIRLLEFLGLKGIKGDNRAIVTLKNHLNSGNKSVALAAARSLAMLGDLAGIKVVSDCALYEDFIITRRYAAETFQYFGYDEQLAAAAQELSKNGDTFIKRHADAYLNSHSITKQTARSSANPPAGYYMQTANNPVASNTRVSCGIYELAAKGVSTQLASILTDRVRDHLVKMSVFDVVEKERMKEVLKEQGFNQTGCVDDACVVEVGKLIGVQKMIFGSFGRFGKIYTINLRVIDLKTGKIEKSVTKDCECPIEEVLTGTSQQAVNEIFGM